MTKNAFELSREKLKNKNQTSTEFVSDINNQKTKEEIKTDPRRYDLEREVKVEDNSIFSTYPDMIFEIPNFEYKDLKSLSEEQKNKDPKEKKKLNDLLIQLGANNNKSILVLLSLLYSTDLYVKNIIDFLHKSQEESQISVSKKTLEEISKTIENKLDDVVDKNIGKAEKDLITKLKVVEDLVNNFIKVEDAFKNKISELKSLNNQIKNNQDVFQTSVNNGTATMNTLFSSLENKVEDILTNIAEEILETQITSLSEHFENNLNTTIQRLNDILKKEKEDGNSLINNATDRIGQALGQIITTLENEKTNISKEIIASVNNGINTNFESLVSQTLPQIDNKLKNWLDTELKPAMQKELNEIKNENQKLKTNVTKNETEMNTMKDKINKMFYCGMFLGITNMALILLFIFRK